MRRKIQPSHRRKICRSLTSHLALEAWNFCREQGNKLLASRFRGDCLYICDWPGCVHTYDLLSLTSHLASEAWNFSREQGNKLLASRFRGDCLYICDWPSCVG
ncbi:hypothetical protein Ccrd_022397 [Cynara cardunculus var. scolymus]|uniref:Uncharacterized protein n=1 Tax=Cynara cardunculus var. scolymus TaxID=59895 RepID=A0A118JZA5_CYNCS|nr:hypothetical protein Ccrd_022397 [Cynara cardunculus var. scolymus]